MKNERLEIIEEEIKKINSEIEHMKYKVEVKCNASPGIEGFYKLKCKILEELKMEQKSLKEIIKSPV
jgi:hypothetical protein